MPRVKLQRMTLKNLGCNGQESIKEICDGLIKHQLKEWTAEVHIVEWRKAEGSRESRTVINSTNVKDREEGKLSLDRARAKLPARSLTGHCSLRYSLCKSKTLFSSELWFCNQDEARTEHIFCHCPALMEKRHRPLGYHFLDEGKSLFSFSQCTHPTDFRTSW